MGWNNDIRVRYIGGCCNKVIETPHHHHHLVRTFRKQIAHWVGCCNWSETQSFAIVTKQWLERIRREVESSNYKGNNTLRDTILGDATLGDVTLGGITLGDAILGDTKKKDYRK